MNKKEFSAYLSKVCYLSNIRVINGIKHVDLYLPEDCNISPIDFLKEEVLTIVTGKNLICKILNYHVALIYLGVMFDESILNIDTKEVLKINRTEKEENTSKGLIKSYLIQVRDLGQISVKRN